MRDKRKSFRIINIAPLFVEHKAEIVSDLLRLEAECGVTDVAFMLPLNPEGKEASLAKAQFLRDRHIEMRDALRASGSSLKIGLLMQSLIGHGTPTEAPFQRIVRNDGSTNNRMCPLDENFKEYIRNVVTMMAATRPAFLLVDDDFRMFCCGYGCFCPLHLAAFNRELGTTYDRESLMAVLQQDDEASRHIGNAWTKSLASGLEDLAKIVRQAIDSVDPKLACGYCAPGDGPGSNAFVVPLARILAGQNDAIVRLNNSWYLGNDARGLLDRLYCTAPLMELLKDIPEILSESDTFPHNRYCTPARAIHAHLVFSMLHGVTGAKLWLTRMYGYEPDSGEAYRAILRANQGLYKTLYRLMGGVTWDEPATPVARQLVSPWNPANYGKGHFSTWAAQVCGHMGIPCRVANGDHAEVIMLTGSEVPQFSDNELRSFLSKGLLLDGGAAEQFCKRGFASQLGVDVGSFSGPVDVERLNDHPINGEAAGRQITLATFFGADNRQITVRDDRVQSLSTIYRLPWYMSPDPEAICPGVTLYENTLGGRVAVYAATIDSQRGFLAYFITVMNESRRRQLIGVLDWLNGKPLPVVVVTDVDLYVRHGVIDVAEGGGELLALFNLNMDPLPDLRLRVAGRRVDSIARLEGDGSWAELKWTAEPNGELTVATPVDTMVPVLLRVRVKES